jgi:glycerol-3-phosphate O-acyltransferase
MLLQQPLNFLARKILYLWVRSEALPNSADQIQLDPDKPVIYVMHARAWSCLLVLEYECHRLGLPSPLNYINHPDLKRWHSVYTIAPRQPFKAWLLKRPKRSRKLRGIIEALHENPELEVQFVPVTTFWGRPVAKQKHWLSILFADSWGIAGRTRRLFTILFQGKNTLLTFSQVITYNSATYSGLSSDETIDRLQQDLQVRLNEMKTATLGPDISHRRTLVRDLLQNPALKEAIYQRSVDDELSEYQASLQARRYLNEIVADCSNISIQLMQRLLTWFWHKFYSEIVVTNHEHLTTLALTHELVYVPCHRSHIDYMLLSYLIHSEGLAIPYIAAGKNLDLPIIGRIFRGGGAFFIRRSFKGNKLYSAALHQYLASLLSLGMPLEYFIEGGRSRSGRLLKPRVGILSMTIRGFLEYKQRPVAFVPVYIGYEKLLESKAYTAELAGSDKKSETLFGSIRAIFNIRGHYGRVYANFAEPVFLNDILSSEHPDWPDESFDNNTQSEWLRNTVGNTAISIMSRINQAAVVNPVNLISTIMLATTKQHMDEQELCGAITGFRSIIRSLDYSDRILITELEPEQQIKHAEQLRMIHRRTHELGDIIYLDARLSISLTYYRNNILHLLALPSLIACCFLNIRSQTRDQIHNLIGLAYPYIKAELFLPWSESELPHMIDHLLEAMSSHGLLLKNVQLDVFTQPASGSAHYAQLKLLARIISPTLEVYYLTLALLSRTGEAQLSKDELENQCYLMAQRIAMIHELNSPDFSDRKLISNFIESLIHTRFLRDAASGHLRFGEAFLRADKHARLLLSKEMRTNILQMLKINQ